MIASARGWLSMGRRIGSTRNADRALLAAAETTLPLVRH